jgi:hypothetical protein
MSILHRRKAVYLRASSAVTAEPGPVIPAYKVLQKMTAGELDELALKLNIKPFASRMDTLRAIHQAR